MTTSLFAFEMQEAPPKDTHVVEEELEKQTSAKYLAAPHEKKEKAEKPDDAATAWFTGSLIADWGQNIDPREWIINPVVYVKNTYGKTNHSWKHQNIPDTLSIENQFCTQVGLTKALDLKIYPEYQINRKKGRSASGWSDFEARIGLQILKDDQGPGYPNVRMTIYELFPIGKYERLKASNHGIDAFGGGSFATTFNLIFSKVFHWFPCHPLNLITNMSYTTHSKVSVHGLNNYGGSPRTKGRVTPGDIFLFDFAFELSLVKRCEFTMDSIIQYTQKTRFRGRNGFSDDGTEASNACPEAIEITLAPGIGYVFNENSYLIVGGQFTVASKNSNEFVTGIINLYYLF